jgi:hypothetical protein
MPIHWRSPLDIAEDNRHSSHPNPDRVVATMVLRCEGCGERITEMHYADGHREYDAFGVISVLGEGVRHGRCPK